MTTETIAALRERGIDLFNAEEFFECHEVWERAWKSSAGVERLFLAGMIQAAVAILHARRGNLAGARSVYGKASRKLDQLPAECMGIALGEFRESLRAFVDTSVTRGEKTAPLPPKLRRLR